MSLRRYMTPGLLLGTLGVLGSAHGASLAATGYVQNFDSLAVTGSTAALPDGWTAYNGDSGGTTSHSTWLSSSLGGTGITANGSDSVATMKPTTAALTVNNAPTGTSSAGIYALNPFGGSTDHVIVSSPTGADGFAWQLALTNTTGAALSSVNVSYDVDRLSVTNTSNQSTFPSVTVGEELPGLELFYSTNGSTWANASSFTVTDPAYATTTGVSSFSGTVNLASAVANGGSLFLRWVDDNGEVSSPDQLLGLNNVSVVPVPLPAGLPLLLGALCGLGLFRRRAGSAVAAA
jgi:hypothetical protein